MKKLFQVGSDLLGEGKILFEWSSKGVFLAACGSKRKVNILDRNGRLYDEIHFPPAEIPTGDVRAAAVVSLQWDPAGEQLAMLPNGNTFVYIWSAISKELLKIETEFKTPQEMTSLAWSKNGVYLAVGTAKGNLLMYNIRERKKTPYLGKHTKKVVSAVWNKDSMLGLAGADRSVTFTDGTTGETVRQHTLKSDPFEICAAVRKDEGGQSKSMDMLYSVNVGRRSICVMDAGTAIDSPLELTFQDVYGDIQTHTWFGDGYILVAFKSGQVVVKSWQGAGGNGGSGRAEEVFSAKVLDVLSDVAYSVSLGRLAVAGGACVRVLDATNAEFKEIKADALDLEPQQSVYRAGWTRDGQVLTVSTHSGQLLSFLAALPVVFDFHGTKVMHLTSLLEMSIIDTSKRGAVTKLEIETEPAFCGLGPDHAAVGMNNQVWFYRVGGPNSSRLVNRRDYLGSITTIKLSSTHAAVLTEGKVIVHPIAVEPGQSMDDFDTVLPPQGQVQTLTCVALTPHFIITGSKQGILTYYMAKDAALVNDYRHAQGGILRLFPQPEAARLIFEDERGNINLFNPVNDHVIQVPGIKGRPENIMWDSVDPNVFVVAEPTQLHVCVYHPLSITGPRVECVGKQPIQQTHLPLMLSSGTVGCRLKNGALDNIVLDTHRAVAAQDALTRAAPNRKFQQNLKLGRLKAAWEGAVGLRTTEAWSALGVTALELLDINMAIAAYRMLGDGSMVLSLERVAQHEDKNLLAAHCLVLLDRDPAQAQELFLRSSQPKAALEMRKDLKHWSEALKLAEQLDPDALGLISKEHAASLEMMGDYAGAKQHYQQALQSLEQLIAAGDASAADAQGACKAGICRCTLQLGDLRAARSQALHLNSQQLFKECAHILEGLSQYSEAAEMYERAGQYERAASIYIQAKNFNAAAPIMAKISSSKLQLQFAKAKEAEGRYGEAAAAYEAAGDLDAVVRLSLEKLNTPQRAYAIVRKTRSVDAAGNLAKYCLQSQDFQGAVEFLLLAGQMDQAFDIAQGHNEMDTFARIVAASAKPTDYVRIAQYYESRGEFMKAGDMWSAAESFPRAVQLYLKARNDAALDKAIDVVEKTKNHSLGVLVLDYVSEEKDGSAKDEYRFKLNIAMGQYQDAARDAMELARLEQEEGNYRVAHDKLFSTVQQLEALKHRVPQELTRALCMLHSYTLVKSLIAINDHMNAARMLVRVARNISKFPKHVVPILTSTIIECNRAGLKQTAFEYAAMLMRPEYRDQVAPKYKKKIELMVRKPDKDAEEVEEALVPCAFCAMPGPETELQCYSCQNIIPFDVATGKRMVLADWAECPTCKFPCGAAQFIRILAAERRCPMCNEEVNLDSVRCVQDPMGTHRRKMEVAGALASSAASLPSPSTSHAGGMMAASSGGGAGLGGAAAAAVAALAYA